MNPFHHISKEEWKDKKHEIILSEEVSFLNKGSIQNMLNNVPENATVIIGATKSKSIHYDVIEIIQDFLIHAKTIGVTVETKGLNLK